MFQLSITRPRLAGLLIAAIVMTISQMSCGEQAEPDSPPIPMADSQAPGESSPLSWRSQSESGLYQISLRPEEGPARVGASHAWVVSLETTDGVPFRPSRLAFDGGMPQHGHGFETRPHVSRSRSVGEFLVDGVRFHMPGDWMLRVEVVGPSGPDVAVFQILVLP